MVDYIFVLPIITALLVLFTQSVRSTIVLTWIVSLLVAARYLVAGLNLVGLGIIFESSFLSILLFGVTQGMELRTQKNKKTKWALGLLFGSVVGVALVFASLLTREDSAEIGAVDKAANDPLASQLLQSHFLSTELLLLLCFIVLIGLGLNLRKEKT